MRAVLVFLFFCFYALAARWYFVCQMRGLCGDRVDTVAVVDPDPRVKTLALYDGDSLILSGYDEFSFQQRAVEPKMNPNNEQFLDSVAGYLQTGLDKKLTITGFYRSNEEGMSYGFFENLGLARAAEVRKLLMRRGIPESAISLDHGVDMDSSFLKPLQFNIYPDNLTPESFEKVLFSFTNMTFSDANFAFDSDLFTPGEAFIMYADSLKTYLGLNPGKTVTIIGHTDDVGKKAYNQDLGLRRAKSAGRYLKDDLGIGVEIKVASKGKDNPVASNQTSEGRQRNRRVNFVIE